MLEESYTNTEPRTKLKDELFSQMCQHLDFNLFFPFIFKRGLIDIDFQSQVSVRVIMI